MTVLTRTSLGIATDTTNTTTAAIVPASGVSIGATVFLVVAGSSATATATVADNAGGGGAANAYTLDGVARGSGTSVWVFRSTLTRATTAATTVITVTFSGAVIRKAISAFYVTGWLVPVALEQSVTNSGTTSPLTTGPTGVTSAADEFVLAAYGTQDASATTYSLASGYSAGSLARASAAGQIRTAVYWWKETSVAAAMSHSATTGAGLMAWTGFLGTYQAAATGTVYTQSLSASMGFSGALPQRATTRRLTGALSFSGAVTRSPNGRVLTGTFTPTGSLSQQQSLVRTLVGATFQPVGALHRMTSRGLAAGLTPTGALTSIKSVSKALSGSFSFSGALGRAPSKQLSASFTPAGGLTFTKALHIMLDGAVFQPVGALSRLTNRKLAGVFAPVGMIASSSRNAFTAVFRPTGTVTHGVQQRTLTAVFAPVGGLSRKTSRLLVASLIASGTLHTQYLPPGGPLPPGGGGYGQPMPDSFFTRYKPTLRRQR